VLRSWGVEAQKRISSSRVLFIGRSLLLAEVAKNVVLAGCGAADVLDPGTDAADAADAADAGNFLALGPEGYAGGPSVAERCSASLRDMNPFVESRGIVRAAAQVAQVRPPPPPRPRAPAPAPP